MLSAIQNMKQKNYNKIKYFPAGTLNEIKKESELLITSININYII